METRTANPDKAEKRVSIRPFVYRGERGFMVSGSGSGMFRHQMFTTTRTSAEWIKVLMMRGIEVELADFQR